MAYCCVPCQTTEHADARLEKMLLFQNAANNHNTNKSLSTVLFPVVKHLGSGGEVKEIHSTASLLFPYIFFRVLEHSQGFFIY